MKLSLDDVPSSDLTCSYGDVERFRSCGIIFLCGFSCLLHDLGSSRDFISQRRDFLDEPEMCRRSTTSWSARYEMRRRRSMGME